MAITIVVIYGLALLMVFLYSIIQLDLLIAYLKKKDLPEDKKYIDWNDPTQVPKVSIQLPIYNEEYVVGRLIDGSPHWIILPIN